MSPEFSSAPVYLFARVWYGFKPQPPSACPFDTFRSLSDDEIRLGLERRLEHMLRTDPRMELRHLLRAGHAPFKHSDHLEEATRSILTLGPIVPWFIDIERNVTKLAKLAGAADWTLELTQVVMHPACSAPPLGPTKRLWIGLVPQECLVGSLIETLLRVEPIKSFPPIFFHSVRVAELNAPTRYAIEVEIEARKAAATLPTNRTKGPALHDLVDAWLTRIAHHVAPGVDFLLRDLAATATPRAPGKANEAVPAKPVSRQIGRPQATAGASYEWIHERHQSLDEDASSTSKVYQLLVDAVRAGECPHYATLQDLPARETWSRYVRAFLAGPGGNEDHGDGRSVVRQSDI